MHPTERRSLRRGNPRTRVYTRFDDSSRDRKARDTGQQVGKWGTHDYTRSNRLRALERRFRRQRANSFTRFSGPIRRT